MGANIGIAHKRNVVPIFFRETTLKRSVVLALNKGMWFCFRSVPKTAGIRKAVYSLLIYVLWAPNNSVGLSTPVEADGFLRVLYNQESHYSEFWISRAMTFGALRFAVW